MLYENMNNAMIELLKNNEMKIVIYIFKYIIKKRE